jgi:1,4-alpha-glucan branching enzyme
MASKDRTKKGSGAGSKVPRTSDAKQGSKTPSGKTEKKPPPQVAAPARHTPRPSPEKENSGPKSVSAAADADHKPVRPGIDAMAILEHAEAEQRAAATSEDRRRKQEGHVSAAEAIARAVVRDHAVKASIPQQPEPSPTPVPSKPRRTPARLAPKAPVPVEPKEPIGGVGSEGLPPPLVNSEEVQALLNAEHDDPFAFLGMHLTEDDSPVIVRAFQPEAQQVEVLDAVSGEVVAKLEKAHDEGLFVGRIPNRQQPFPYRLRLFTVDGVTTVDDPYRFPSVLADKDLKQLSKGEYPGSYEVLGAHQAACQGVEGTTFAVWAPHALHVAVVGDFNGWDGRRHGMRLHPEYGVWEIFLPAVAAGALYKYEVKSSRETAPQTKSDPYAFATEPPPGFASVVQDTQAFSWRDADWMEHRPEQHGDNAPVAFYEVHLGSWRRNPGEGDRWLTYRELADELVEYVVDLGFTHIALLPISEYTFDDTVGYLPSALYAPTGRFGTPDDFRYFVNACHCAGVGVSVDWVPNYVSEEPHGLRAFDGTSLYEHPDPQQGRDPDWNLPMYDLGRPEVASYLLDNACYWLDRFHVDGLRFDSLAKMLYRDYGRADGEWTPNAEGGNENLEALAFVRLVNQRVAKQFPGALMIAEDSSLRSGLTKPIKDGGLGFALRWNSAWSYDTLRYLGRHPVHRKYYQYELTNPLTYAFDERFVLPISHDHVSIGQGSMLGKLPGDRWQKFATLRAWYALMYGLPGKKLMFMGTEFAQDREWNSNISLDWHLMEDSMHSGVHRLVRDLNALYCGNPALHELDSSARGFEWIDFSDEDDSVVAFIRYSKDRQKHVIVVTHFTPVARPEYRIGVPKNGRYKEILNTDAEAYGGGNAGSAGGVTAESEPLHGREYSVRLLLPPYATIVLEPAE